jgi:hypothetical protein
MWRPEGWIPEISFEEISKISPRLVSMMTIKEKKLYEAGADAMLEALKKNTICFIDKGGFYHDIKPETAGYLVFIPEDVK